MFSNVAKGGESERVWVKREEGRAVDGRKRGIDKRNEERREKNRHFFFIISFTANTKQIFQRTFDHGFKFRCWSSCWLGLR